MARERLASQDPPFTRRLNVSLDDIPKEEQTVSNILARAVLAVAPIYELQQNSAHAGANFYPHDASKEEIEEAARRDPDILSEFTVVRRDGSSGLVAVPYHIEYSHHVRTVAKALSQASQRTTDENLAHYLKLRAESLVDGDYEKSERVWLSNPEPEADIVIGPYERYKDGLFNKKFTYLGWTGILEREQTQEAQQFIDAFLRAYGWQGEPVRARVDRTRIFGGYASSGLSASNLPCQREWREKYGSKITVFLPYLQYRVDLRLPILRQVSESTRDLDSTEALRLSKLFLFGHEASHSLIRRPGDEGRLKSRHSLINELYADTLAVYNSRKLIGKEISQKDWEQLLSAWIFFGLSLFLDTQSKAAPEYVVGKAIALNFLQGEGAIGFENGRLKINSAEQLETGLKVLVDRLEWLVSGASEEEAADFREEFGDARVFTQFAG